MGLSGRVSEIHLLKDDIFFNILRVTGHRFPEEIWWRTSVSNRISKIDEKELGNICRDW